LRGYFVLRKAEDAGGLTPAEDDNAAGCKIDRKDWTIFKFADYKLCITAQASICGTAEIGTGCS